MGKKSAFGDDGGKQKPENFTSRHARRRVEGEVESL